MSCKRDRTATCSTSAQSNKRRGRPVKYDVENVNCNRPVEDSLEQGHLLKSRSSYPGKRNKGRPGFVPNDNLFHSTGHLQLQRKLSSSLLRDVSNIVGNSSSSRSPFPPTEPFIPQKEHSMTIDSDDHVDDTYHDPGVANQSESITNENQIPPEYNNLGPPTAVCQYFHAVMWKEERNNKKVTRGTPKFSLCCCNGQVKLPPSKSTPAYLKYLYSDKVKGPTFKKCIRIYNAMLSFTSMGGNIDHSINKGRGPYVFKLNGVNHHRFGSLLPNEREQPKFCQLYIYDTENEVDNRIRTINLEDSNLVNPEILENLLKMLDETNELVKCFRMARDRFKDEHIVDLKIVMKVSRSTSGRENHMTPSNEVAAIMVGDNDDTCCRRDIVIESKIDGLKRISDLHPLLMALQYPLLFLYCEDGYHEEIYYVDCNKPANKKRQKVTQMEFYAHQLMVRPSEGLTLRLGGRLYQQFIVDAFSAVEQSRLWWIRCNQKTLRNELYHNLCDLMNRDDVDASNVGKGFILPASFVASQRYMFQNFQDALAVCLHIGHPDLFTTMTCNPLWDEVLKMMSLLPGCCAEDCPDIITRVFKLKLDQLYKDIKKNNFFGRCVAVMYVIEYQKRGLPHVHMLIWLHTADKTRLSKDVDNFVSAEIPNESTDPYGYQAVKQFMIHGPCGADFQQSPCMKKSPSMKDYKCTRHFPKKYCSRTMFDESGFPPYRRRKTGITVKVRNAVLDNQWVVPFNRNLLVRYQCHINIEICNQARCVKYLFKYCLKGPDRATVMLQTANRANISGGNIQDRDEIKTYLDGRYVCGAEATHRLFGFDVHHRTTSVERLPVHLPNEKTVTFKDSDDLEWVCKKAETHLSKLEAFFELNRSDEFAKTLTYQKVPRHFVWDSNDTAWTRRLRSDHVGRIVFTHHSIGELWYLRLLLTKVSGPTSFRALRTVGGVIHNTYQEACAAYGLLSDDKEWHEAIKENEKSAMPIQLRQLFVYIIVNCQVMDVLQLWHSYWRCLSDDIEYQRRRLTGNCDLKLMDTQIQFYAIAEIEKLLSAIGKSLKNFPTLPMPPSSYLDQRKNMLILEETSYDKMEMLLQHEQLSNNLNPEQRHVYNSIIGSVERNEGGMFFVYGSGGCGKTYLWKTIITRLRSESKIVLPVASSGIAATLLPGGRTAHSRFKIPLRLYPDSTCSICHNSYIAELIKETSLIIWDEAPMQNRYAFEALDRSLRDIMKVVSSDRLYKPFGGITMLLGGDFRQILPVVKGGGRSDIVSACISRSKLWDLCQLFVLKENMRLHLGESVMEKERIKEFGKWVLAVGNGKLHFDPNQCSDFDYDIQIPSQYCIMSDLSSIDDIINNTYDDLEASYMSQKYLSERAILTPTNQVVDHLNDLIMDKIPGKTFTYYSYDIVKNDGGESPDSNPTFPVEYLNSIKMAGLLVHELRLKEGVVVMLMRNLSQTLGLCNGIRLMVKKCMKYTVKCEVISGKYVGSFHLIPRMDMCPTDTKLSFQLVRKQLPLQICFAMTINKAQGQSLNKVGLYLSKPVFCHGQLYVAVSRVTSPDGLKVFIDSDCGGTTNVTKNVVYEEVFYNLPTT